MTDKPAKLTVAEDEYQEARQEIVDYITETSGKRILLVTDGHIRQALVVLSAEMALAGSLGQIDTVLALGRMAEALVNAEATLAVTAAADYRRRFGEDIGPEADGDLRG
jgi:hypothetical protein